MVLVRLVTRPTASWLGRYRSSLAALSTFSLVSVDSRCTLLLSTRDTVATERPVCLAISLSVTRTVTPIPAKAQIDH